MKLVEDRLVFSNLEIDNCHTVRLVNESDASFIALTRERYRNKGFLSESDNTECSQKIWIQQYKERERSGSEYYFIMLLDNVRVGVMRIYDVTDSTFTSGSWLFADESAPNLAIFLNLVIRIFGFSNLNKTINYFDVRKTNSRVLSFNRLLAPTIIAESDLSFFFKLDRDTFNSKIPNLSRFAGYDLSKELVGVGHA